MSNDHNDCHQHRWTHDIESFQGLNFGWLREFFRKTKDILLSIITIITIFSVVTETSGGKEDNIIEKQSKWAAGVILPPNMRSSFLGLVLYWSFLRQVLVATSSLYVYLQMGRLGCVPCFHYCLQRFSSLVLTGRFISWILFRPLG